jgi:hypothetical protein
MSKWRFTVVVVCPHSDAFFFFSLFSCQHSARLHRQPELAAAALKAICSCVLVVLRWWMK